MDERRAIKSLVRVGSDLMAIGETVSAADPAPTARAEETTTVPSRTWLITGVSSGFGRELDRASSSSAATGSSAPSAASRRVADLAERHPDTFRVELLDVTDTPASATVVDRASPNSGASTSS